MPTKREVLDHLKRDELVAALDAYDLSVYDRRQRGLIVDGPPCCGELAEHGGGSQGRDQQPRPRLRRPTRDEDAAGHGGLL